MLLASTFRGSPSCSFILIDENEWQISDVLYGPETRGVCLHEGRFYCIQDGILVAYNLNGNGAPDLQSRSQTDIYIPDGHSLISNGQDLLCAATGLNEIWKIETKGAAVKVVGVIAPTNRRGYDYSHINSLFLHNNGSVFVSMLCWHRTDEVRWRDLRRLGVIVRCENLFNQGSIDIIRSGLQYPHSITAQGDDVYFCSARESTVFLAKSYSLPPYLVRGLCIVGKTAYVGGSSMGTDAEAAQIFRINTNTDEIDCLSSCKADIYEIIRIS